MYFHIINVTSNLGLDGIEIFIYTDSFEPCMRTPQLVNHETYVKIRDNVLLNRLEDSGTIVIDNIEYKWKEIELVQRNNSDIDG